MCGRYYFSADSADERIEAILRMLEKSHPGQYKTGEILPGDAAPAVVSRQGKLIPIPAVFGFPGFSEKKLLLRKPERLKKPLRKLPKKKQRKPLKKLLKQKK